MMGIQVWSGGTTWMDWKRERKQEKSTRKLNEHGLASLIWMSENKLGKDL